MEKEKGLRDGGNEGEEKRGKSDEFLGSGDLGIGGQEWFGGGGVSVGDEIGKLFGEVGGGASFWGGGNVGQGFGLDGIHGGFGEKFQFGGSLGGLDGGGGIHLWGNECLFDRGGHFWGGEASGIVDSQGVQGCLSVDVCGNGGEIGEVRDGNGEDRSGDGGGQGSKGKRGRPKGSKNKKKVAEEGGVGLSGTASVNVGGEESVTPKKKLGRPKGSKNKKVLADDGNGVVPDGGEESKVVAGNESVGPKRKVSRPKGPKRKTNLTGVEDNGMSRDTGAVTEGIEISVLNHPTGSAKEMLSVEQKGKMIAIESDGHEVGNEVVKSKKRRGPPKKLTAVIDGTTAMSNQVFGRTCTGGPIAFFMGLENENPVFGSKEDTWLPDVQPKVNLEHKMPIHTGEKDMEMYKMETLKGKEGAGIVQPKRKRGRPKVNLEQDMPIHTGGKDLEMYKKEALEDKEDVGILQPKRKRGRPKGPAKKKNLSGDEISEMLPGEIMGIMGDGGSIIEGKEDGGMAMEASVAMEGGKESVQVKKKRGQPKGWTKKNDVAVKENEGTTKTVVTTASENGRTEVAGDQAVTMSSETNCGNDIQTKDVHSQLNEIQEKFEALLVGNDGDGNDAPVVSLENEKDKGMSAACGSNEGKKDVVQQKRRGRPTNKRPIASAGEDQCQEGENVRKNDCGDESSKRKVGRTKKKKRRIIRPNALSKITVLMHQNYLKEDLSSPTMELQNSEDTEKKLQKRPRGRPRKINNQPINHSELRTQQLKNSEDTEKKVCKMLRGKRPRGRPRLCNNLPMNHSDFCAQQLKNSEITEKKIFKRPRGRPRKFNNLQAYPRDLNQGIPTDTLERRGNLWCHQCLRNDRNGVVICLNCKKKRYCYDCLAKW